MQWLIDLVWEKILDNISTFTDAMWQSIFDTGIYHYRGDTHEIDYIKSELTLNGTWRELSLGTLVRVNSRAVHLSVVVQSSNVNGYICFRIYGGDDGENYARCDVQVANVRNFADVVVALDGTNRKIEYLGDGLTTRCDIKIRGSWY